MEWTFNKDFEHVVWKKKQTKINKKMKKREKKKKKKKKVNAASIYRASHKPG